MMGGVNIHIVKKGRERKVEDFDSDKLQKSIVAACLSSGMPLGHAEATARGVTKDVTNWLKSHQEVTSDDLKRIATKYLKIANTDAGYLYEKHQSTF